MKSTIDQSFNFLIVGGGSAGWVSALFVRSNFPDANITVVQSSEIGILGAGEGTTPHIVDYLDEIDIPISELVKNCKATIKNGIRFSNWNSDKNFYYHPFPDNHDLDNTLVSELQHTTYPLLDLEIIANSKSLDTVNFNAIASQRNCVRFVPNPDSSYKDLDPILHFIRLGRIALHFDANLLASYLEKVGRLRNITVVDAKIDDLILSDQGYITAVKTDIGAIPCDFVFDCSGFRRLIIGKKFDIKWCSYKKNLPTKRAMPFFIPNNTEIIPPYTDSTALKWGWMWKIPVQGRYGCGYVYDSDRISDELAKAELDSEIGFDVEVPRIINFEPGRYDKIYEKNCLAIGLSAGFIEPLEATSIWTSIMMLRSWVENIGAVTHRDQLCKDTVNQRFRNMSDNTLGFVYFHYITQRNDTEFWSRFTEDNKVPDSLQLFMDESKYTIPSSKMLSNMGQDFAAKSFLACGSGQQFFNSSHAKQLFDSFNTGKRKIDYELIKFKYFKNINLNLSTLIDHHAFLQYLKVN